MGANTGYWQIRYDANRRTIVEYRNAAADPETDPALKTVRFRDLETPRPECELLGVQSGQIGIRDYAVDPTSLSDPWFAGTGFTAASTLPGLVGYEWDSITPGCLTPSLTDLFHYEGHQYVNADAVRYTAASGARVFSAGSFRFSWGLDPSAWPGDPGSSYRSAGLQIFMRNALDDLTRPAPPTGVAVVRTQRGVRVFVRGHQDARTQGVFVYAHVGTAPFAVPGPTARLVCALSTWTSCLDRSAPRRHPVVYAALVRDRWRLSVPTFSKRATFARAVAPRLTVAEENQLPGTPNWLLQVQLHVSTAPAARYRLAVFRLGWYQGLGARRILCIPSCSTDKPGSQQAVPAPDPATGLIAAGWPVSDTFTVPESWTSGYYVLELVLTSGPQAGTGTVVPLIVREPISEASAILVVAPVNTWEAYNVWGGKSLYESRIGDAKSYAHEVSFERPYDPTSSPFQSPLYWEYPLVRFLERNGYEVSYTTDVDVDRDPTSLLRHRLVIVAGHSEYWTKGTFDAYLNARDAGTNLAFLGGNDGYWQIRYADADQSIVEWRTAAQDPDPDPAQKTVRFRDLSPPRPECALTGIEWQGGWRLPPGSSPTDGESSTGTRAGPSYTVPASAVSNPWFSGTGFAPGSTLTGIVGYEWDAAAPGCAPSNLTVLFHYRGQPTATNRPPYERTFLSTNADAVTYTAPSGARVVSAGSIQFSWGLDGFAQQLHAPYPADDRTPADPRLQRLMQNVFDDLSSKR
jgi:hypothetical protein